MPADTRDAIVYLTLPARQAGALEFQESERAGPEIRDVVEERTWSTASPTIAATSRSNSARPNLRFGVTRDQTYGRVLCGLARVREVQNKRAMFDDRYIPPTLDIAAARPLKRGLADILGRAEQRADELALRAVEATDGGAETFASFLLLQALNRWVPVLRHLESLPTVHPERLFEQLSSLAGELATLIRPERKPPPLPRYDHENLQVSFDPVFDLLQIDAVGGVRPFGGAAAARPDRAGRVGLDDHRPHSLPDGYFYLAVPPRPRSRKSASCSLRSPRSARSRRCARSSIRRCPACRCATRRRRRRSCACCRATSISSSIAASPDWREFATAPALGLHVAGDWPQLEMELWCMKTSKR